MRVTVPTGCCSKELINLMKTEMFPFAVNLESVNHSSGSEMLTSTIPVEELELAVTC